MMSKRVSVIVIGGSHAGLAVSQKLLRQTPRAAITLINPSDEYYFNIAAPRFLVKPASLPPTKYLYSIPEAFREHPPGSFTFVKGLVTKIDYSTKSVAVALSAGSTAGTVTSFEFDYLVIASGSSTPATLGQAGLRLPFKATAFEDTGKAILDAQAKLKAARTVLIGGGGPLGVEIAGELAEAAGPKKITLVSRTSVLLEGATEPVQRRALSLLRLKDVEVLTATTVVDAVYEAHSQTWKVKLSSGQTYTADAYIATTGTIPNNQYIPKSCLNSQGWVNVDEHLRVVEDGGETVASNIASAIEGRSRLATYSTEAQTKMMVVPVGQSTGTGHLGGWTLFGCIVWFFKGKDFLTYEAPKFLRGQVR
ncbi:apoptosis-inducing factor 2 [Aspergillus udagawae]|uniref:Apoptosis-inducing factor 2 n=1 Tax=Aspergillus udagawae TaxID=91492 RepID=A0A8H3P6N9_9EURO|nr:apoptosis-inducing factor 2 [Aspergillus udagawae]